MPLGVGVGGRTEENRVDYHGEMKVGGRPMLVLITV